MRDARTFSSRYYDVETDDIIATLDKETSSYADQYRALFNR